MSKANQPSKLSQVFTSQIQRNPHNPRRLFDDEPMKILLESIDSLGILVPVTLYKPKKKSKSIHAKKYVLLDGERRWKCAKNLKLKYTPANIIEEPKDIQNILTMFHIHNLREGWQLMPTALKLQTLMTKLNIKSDKKLSIVTKLSIQQVQRCKILLSYPKSYQNLMLAPPTERLKTDFFIELHRLRSIAKKKSFPVWKKIGDSKCISLLLTKYLDGYIKSVTEFRKLNEIYRIALDINMEKEFLKRLDYFLRTPKATIEDMRVEGASFAIKSKEIRKIAIKLRTKISDIDFELIAADIETIDTLKSLQIMIKNKLDSALLIDAKEAAQYGN